MRAVFIVVSMFFFLGCSAKYKSVNEYVLPTSETGKVCLKECQKQYGSCKEICKANFQICQTKAKQHAKANFETKTQEYVRRLERYAVEMQMYEFERDFYYLPGYYGYGYGYRGIGLYHPHRMFWMQPYPYFRPVKPKKPILEEEIKLAEMQMCQIDCGCLKTYDSCFVECGGSVKQKQICIANCPDEK
ncbi:MAG: hypothetical protein K0U47_07335 [Epsilonproteobacteria bacterium]|nr:hypothetical protein [Campylobacterota bacterium]